MGVLQRTMTSRTRLIVLLLWTVTMVAVPSSASAPNDIDLIKFFVNETFLQQQFPCSLEKLECFKNQQLLNEADGRCYTVGEQGPCAEGEIFHADKKEASRKGGHIRGNCCSGCGDVTKFPVGATGECLTKAEVEEKICREDLYLRPALDAFGQWICVWTKLPCEFPERRPLFKGQYDDMEYNGLCYPPDIFRNWNSEDQNVTMYDNETSNHPAFMYFTNTTYREREYPCTDEEKICLQYGRLLHSDGNCYIPGQWSNACSGSTFNLDWEEVKNGRLIGICNSTCTAYQKPNIANGQCESVNVMQHVCLWEWGMVTLHNEFGQMACKCTWSPNAPLTPKSSLPPPAAAPGLCKVPDFSNPVQPPTYDMTLTVGFRVRCTEEEFACLREGRVLVDGACHALRTQGSCAEGEELVIDKYILAHGDGVVGLCKPRPCPEGSVLMPIDGQCLTHEQVFARLCNGQKVSLDEFGGWQCDYEGTFPANLTRIVRHESDGTCELPDKYSVDSGNPIHPQYSPANDAGFMKNFTSEPADSVDSNTIQLPVVTSKP